MARRDGSAGPPGIPEEVAPGARTARHDDPCRRNVPTRRVGAGTRENGTLDETKRRRPLNAIDAAEAVFRPAPPARAPEPARPATVPGARELVSLRIDADVLAHFQEGGPGWQDRLNQALRRAAGLG